MKKSVILYSRFTTPKRIGTGHAIIALDTNEGAQMLCVRAEVIVGKSALEALDMARPLKGETVLNSVELPE